MNLEAFFTEEVAIHRLEAGQKRNFRITIYCMVLAVAFAIVDWQLIVTTELSGLRYWTLVIVFSFIPLAFAGIAVMV